MLTPVFNVDQSDDTVTISIRAPYAKISDTEIDIDGQDFLFYSKPYFLRLKLPGCLQETDSSAITYDSDKGWFKVIVKKESGGEHFAGLNLLSGLLLAPPGKCNADPPGIEVVSGEKKNGVGVEESEEREESLDVDSSSCYGFACRRSQVFAQLQDELEQVVDVRDADKKSIGERCKERLLAERRAFSDDHYLFDLYENDDDINDILRFKPHFASISNADDVSFSNEEKERMLQLPKRQYIIEERMRDRVLLSLVDVVYAYCYDLRTTLGQHTVESSWTLSKLSATLSWLHCFTDLHDVKVSCFRRSLCYPLYRHWKLNTVVWNDTIKVFTLGEAALVKCLLNIEHIFAKGAEHQYILNDLYITDYCVWLSAHNITNAQLQRLLRDAKEVCIEKRHVGLDVLELEEAAVTVMKDCERQELEQLDSDDDEDDLPAQLSNLTV